MVSVDVSTFNEWLSFSLGVLWLGDNATFTLHYYQSDNLHEKLP
jgi:hypothetical protein